MDHGRRGVRSALALVPVLLALPGLLALTIASSTAAGLCVGPKWVAAWSAAPQDSSRRNPVHPGPVDTGPEVGDRRTFHDQTLRMIVTPHYGGEAVRVTLSNRYGTAPVTLDDLHVGIRATGASLASNLRLTVGGVNWTTIPPGAEVVTDPVALTVRPFQDLAVSFHVVGASPLDQHLDALQTQFATPVGAGALGGVFDGLGFTEQLSSWLVVTAVDVRASRPAGAVVALGDSLTDGYGSSLDTNNRWPDQLARRAVNKPTSSQLSILNAGIGGNQVARDFAVPDGDAIRGMGPSAVNRLDADVLRRAGVTDVIVFEGINDIFAPASADPVGGIIRGYLAIIDRAHAAGLRVTGATLTPAGQSDRKEEWRQAVNHWIRTSGAFDEVVDFDAAVRDPAAPNHLRPAYRADFVHLNDAGYRALANAVPLKRLQGSGCA